MSVMRNTFSGTLSASTNISTSYKKHTITGLTSETSTTNINYMNPEASIHFLNALYKTIVDAGYGDAIKNDDEYSITVIGFKFFVFIVGSNGISPNIYTTGTTSSFSSSGSDYINNYSSNSTKKELEYNITIRGDSNHISIYYGSYNNPTAEHSLFSIAKGKNLITSSDIYMFGRNISNSSYIYMREKNDLYNCFANSVSNPMDKYTEGNKGLNTNSKFVCVPQLAYYNTCLIYSMIKGNSVVFTINKYYKIGNEIYFNENGYLFKVG